MIKKFVGIAVLSLGLAGVAALPAHAAPIVCPPGQVATINPSVEGGWSCVNAGGNTNLSEDPKNPNADKGDYQH